MIDWRPISEPAPDNTPLLVFMPDADGDGVSGMTVARRLPDLWVLEYAGLYAEDFSLPAPPSHWALIEGPKP